MGFDVTDVIRVIARFTRPRSKHKDMASNTLLRVTPTIEDYRNAAALLWGDAGRYAVDAFERINVDVFDGMLPPIPIVIGLSAYGHCIGLTRSKVDWIEHPRISLVPKLFNRDGLRTVDDVLVHEMLHASLMLRGRDARHNLAPWCEEITRLSPIVLGHEINAHPVRPRRIENPERQHDENAPKTIVKRAPLPGAMTQGQLARWPHSVRPTGYYDDDTCIGVPTY